MRNVENIIESRRKFGANVRNARKEQSLTQEQLALMTGRDRGFISRVECGKSNASLETIVVLAGGLGVDPSQLMDGILEQTSSSDVPVPVALTVPNNKQSRYKSTSI